MSALLTLNAARAPVLARERGWPEAPEELVRHEAFVAHVVGSSPVAVEGPAPVRKRPRTAATSVVGHAFWPAMWVSASGDGF